VELFTPSSKADGERDPQLITEPGGFNVPASNLASIASASLIGLEFR
jgi:hypothetical protein